MATAISVRLDEAQRAVRAVRVLEASGLSTSEVIRASLIESAKKVRRRSELAKEVAALEADEEDRAEMLSVAAMMESMRATR